MRHTRCWPWIVSIVWLAATVESLRATSPDVSSVSPTGGTRGSDVELLLRGARLANAQELLLYEPGLAVAKIEPVGPNGDQVKALIKIAPDARLGEYHLRLRTTSGLSRLHTFWVGRLPVVAETEPNSNFAQPQKIALNTTVAGIAANEDIDYYAVEAKKGQLITAEVEAIRLGRALSDVSVAILDAKRFELDAADDTPLLAQDGFAQAIAPADGTYIVSIRESSFAGADNFVYRLHIGDFPRPTAVYPAGGQAGQPLAVSYLGDKLGPMAAELKLPDQPTARFAALAERDGRSAMSANPLRVSPFANVLEIEPNNGFDRAMSPTGVPIALNGIIGEPRDVDIFRITLAQGQVVDLRVFARTLGSPLDPVLDMFDASGKHLGGNDDEGANFDSFLRFTAPAAGEYFVHLRDQLLGGGADYVYRVEVTPVAPRLTLTIPEVARNDNQTRQWIAVPRGNRWTALFQANRYDFGGPLQLSADDLPPGVTMHAPQVSPNVGTVAVVFEAAADAPLSGKLVDLRAQHADANAKIAGG
ncbi:MAG TPA: PPC domain-containing protein, partial [Pirellulales bacterium]|nr:PPC domain-containing protein [Pirellulales bacterium]